MVDDIKEIFIKYGLIDSEKHKDMSPEDKLEKSDKKFKEMDLNKDERISLEEWI
jgi:hypothetical protein